MVLSDHPGIRKGAHPSGQGRETLTCFTDVRYQQKRGRSCRAPFPFAIDQNMMRGHPYLCHLAREINAEAYLPLGLAEAFKLTAECRVCIGNESAPGSTRITHDRTALVS